MNSPNQHDESLERIRSRAKELLLISGGPDTADAETLAAFVDGTLALDEISEATARRWVDLLGADALISDRLRAASEFQPSQVLNEVIVPSEMSSSVFGGSGDAEAPAEGTGSPVELQPPPIPHHAHRPWWRRPIVGLTTATAVVAVAVMLSLFTHRHTPGFSSGGPANQPLRALQWPLSRAFDSPSLSLHSSSLRAWVQRQPLLPTRLPDFASSQSTLGSGGTDHFGPWRLATVIVRSEDGWGSGAIISADGWVLTNYHVVANPAQSAALGGEPASLDIITAQVVEGHIKPRPALQATLYRADPVHDLALLKLRALPPGQTALPYFRLASHLQDAEDCYVIGSQANGPAWWIRSGRVSQQFDYPDDLSEFAAGVITSGADVSRDRATVVVSDTRISPGDSGGPLLNAQGELIGLTFATAANATAGSVGWHIALKHLQNFIAELPHQVEGVPFDVWTAGLPKATILQPELADADHDGRIDSLRYLYAARTQDSDALQPLAFTVFVDLQERSGNGKEPLDLVPVGIWGMDRGRFRFDVFLTARADQVRVAGYTDSQGIVDEIRIARPHEDAASVIWHRDNHGGWTATKPSSLAPLIGPTRLAGRDLHRLQVILNQIGAGANNPSSAGSDKGKQP